MTLSTWQTLDPFVEGHASWGGIAPGVGPLQISTDGNDVFLLTFTPGGLGETEAMVIDVGRFPPRTIFGPAKHGMPLGVGLWRGEGRPLG